MNLRKIRKDERGDTVVAVFAVGFFMTLVVFGSALYITERTYAQSWGRSVTRTAASVTSLLCANYQTEPPESCVFLTEDYLDRSPYCRDITGQQSIQAWSCEWNLGTDRIPDYLAEVLQIYYSPRTSPETLYLETRGTSNQIYVRIRLCARAAINPVARWCGTEEAYQYI